LNGQQELSDEITSRGIPHEKRVFITACVLSLPTGAMLVQRSDWRLLLTRKLFPVYLELTSAMGNKLCATWQKGYHAAGLPWPPRKEPQRIRWVKRRNFF